MGIRWNELSDMAKFLGIVFAMAAGAIAWSSTHFETAEASQQKWAEHNRQIACNKVYELEDQIRKLKRERENATPERKADIDDDIAWKRDTIRRIDPTGDCSA